MFRIWMQIKGSVKGIQGDYFKTKTGIWQTNNREEARQKVFSLNRKFRPYTTTSQIGFKIVEAI